MKTPRGFSSGSLPVTITRALKAGSISVAGAPVAGFAVGTPSLTWTPPSANAGTAVSDNRDSSPKVDGKRMEQVPHRPGECAGLRSRHDYHHPMTVARTPRDTFLKNLRHCAGLA